MEEQTDNTFIKNVSIVLAILVAFTIAIVFIARDIGFKDEEGDNPSRNTTAEERIRPVADVHTGEAGAAAIAEAASTSAPEQTAAFDGSLDGEMIYTRVCAVCHTTGAAGAPKPGSPEMALRAEKGQDALLQSALNGLNAMPARGGRADLTDEQVQVSIEFMLK
ncbi:c-type cytochrome [Pseudomonadota bacterium]